MKNNSCANCGYYYKTEDDCFPCCHFEGPEGWAPCEGEEDDYEEEEEEEYPELIFDPEEE